MKPLAILCSDLHFSAVVPSARSAEPNWLLAQKRYIDQLKVLQKQYAEPIIVAGDFFHDWRSPQSTHELVNFLIEELPDSVYSIFGQHDLSNHRYEDKCRSPLWTLMTCGKVKEIEPGIPLDLYCGIICYGFSWGYSVKPLHDRGVIGSGSDIHLAVVHSYIWKAGCNYPNAPVDQHATECIPKLKGYDASVWGDNHRGFMFGRNHINTGTFLRRHSDERDYKPMVGILYDDGHIEPHYLDTSADLWLGDGLPEEHEKPQVDDDGGLLNSLNELGPDALDFHAALGHCMDRKQSNGDVRRVVLSATPGKK